MLKTLARIAGLAVAATAPLSLFVTTASATGNSGSAAGYYVHLGQSPTGIPANCPFVNGDAALSFVSGQLMPQSAPGDAQGAGEALFLLDGQALYLGHATFAQNNNSVTVSYHGTELSGPGSLDFNVNINMVHGFQNVNIRCS
jgi:hypothetical protein